MSPARIMALIACVLVMLGASTVLTDYVALGAAESIERAVQSPVGVRGCDATLGRGDQSHRCHAIRSSFANGPAMPVDPSERRSPPRQDGPAAAAMLHDGAPGSADMARAQSQCASLGGVADVHLERLHCRAPPTR